MGSRVGWLVIAAVAGLVLWSLPGRNVSTTPGTAASGEDVTEGARAAVGDVFVLPAVIDTTPRPVNLVASQLRAALRRGVWTVTTPGGSRFEVRDLRERPERAGLWSLSGRVETAVGPQSMVLTIGPDAIFGVVPRPDGHQLHVTTRHRTVAIALVGRLAPPGRHESGDNDFVVPPGARLRTPGNESAPLIAYQADAADAAGPTRIDVLGLYTDDLVAMRGSVAAAETEVTNLFAIADQAHVDSATGIAVRLVALRQVASDPSKTNRTILDDITYNRVAGTDLVALRDASAADLVALVRPYYEGNGSCGVAWLAGSGLSPEATTPQYGFSVNNIAPCSPYVLAHELGHNTGSMHDLETSTSSGVVTYGAYPFSFGYRQNGPPGFATIMAYTQAGQPRVGYFSDPGSARCGAPCGVIDKADNVRSLKLMGSRVAAFRGAPGTLSIIDSDAFEPDPQLGSADPRVWVRLSGTAPPQGVSFSLAFSGGTAIPDVDYAMPTLATYVIPAGQSEVSIPIRLIGDTLVEPDEGIEIQLMDVVGATVDDGIAMLTIRNEDPRIPVTGKIRFPPGMTVPTAAFPLHVAGLNGDAIEHVVTVSPPYFTYRLPAVPRANLSIFAFAPAPFVNMPVRLDGIHAPRTYDHAVEKGHRVGGRIRVPEGDPALQSPVYLDVSSSLAGAPQPLLPIRADPPDFNYAVWVVPDAWVRMRARVPPYADAVAIRTRVPSDWAQDLPLSRLPGVSVWARPVLDEGRAGTSSTLWVLVELSAPAPEGGVRIRYATMDGTATAGSDYTATSGMLEFPAGDTSRSVMIRWAGDDVEEGEEHFRLVLSDIVGANPVTTELTFWLQETDPVMSRPLPPDRAP